MCLSLFHPTTFTYSTREVGKGRQLAQWGPVGEFPKLAAVAMIRDIEKKAKIAASIAQYCYNIQ